MILSGVKGNHMQKEKIPCDICSKTIHLTPKAKYELEREGWLVYCGDCFQKTGMTMWEAKKQQIKIYGGNKKTS